MADNEGTPTVTGRYAFVPNPCTTQPCLPGMAYAIESGGQCFFLTLGGRWSDQAHTWEGWMPSLGDTISVRGSIRQRLDIRGDPYFTIEAESVVPAG
jgi:hypothetical protein